MSRARLAQCRAYLIDMDGTLYLDEQLLPGARALLDWLDRNGAPYVFVTNNSSRSGIDYLERLDRLGIAADRRKVLTSGDATIQYLLESTNHRSVYLVGTPALERDFTSAGLSLDDRDPDCVVVAFDTTLTYRKLEDACRLLFAGKPYFATHPDKTCITQRGLVPDIAAIIAACEAVTGRTPDRMLGKPSAEMVEVALRRLGTDAQHTAIIGDQLDTDMAMATRSGILGVLVMTGETSHSKLASWPSDQQPDLVCEGLDQLVAWLGQPSSS